MDENLLLSIVPIFIIGAIALIIGGLIGAVLANALQTGSNKNKRNAQKNLAKVLFIWRDRKTGKLVLDLDDQVYPTFGQMNARRQATLQQILDEIRIWLGVSEAGVRISAPVRPTMPDGGSGFIEQPAAKPVQKQEGIVPGSINSTSSIRPPSMDLGDILTSVVVPDAKPLGPPSGEPISIAAQIDKIVQEKLPSTPLRGRSIRLMETASQGLVVMVDGKSYEGIGDVPDSQVREFIQSCVAEWEKTV